MEVEGYFLAFRMGSRTCIRRNLSLLKVGKVILGLVREFEFLLDGEVKRKEWEWECKSKWFVKPVGFKGLMVKRERIEEEKER